MPDSSASVDQSSGSSISATFSPGDTAVHQLTSASIPCRRVKLLAPVSSAGVAANTSPVFYGPSDAQKDWIAIDGSRDNYFHVDNVNKIFVKMGTSSDTLNYRIEK